MKTDNSLECCRCHRYNIEQGVIMDGDIYCWNCINGDNLYLQQKHKELKKEQKNEKRNKKTNIKSKTSI